MPDNPMEPTLVTVPYEPTQLPSLHKQPPLPSTAPPPPTAHQLLLRKYARALKLQVRAITRRNNVKARVKRPPKALSELRREIGRLKTLIED